MLNFERDERTFDFRSAAVIIQQHHLLVSKGPHDEFWALPGGRVEFFEHSDDTLPREIKEELGLESRVVRPLWYVENFFTYLGRPYHEVSTYYLTEIDWKATITSFEVHEGIERDKYLVFQWVPLNALKELMIKPEFLVDGVNDLPSSLQMLKLSELS